MKTTLIIMAAGIGSRFGGGIKQLAKMGPNGEIIMDYSIYDAKEAGFDKVVFIIRKDIEKEFKEVIGNRIQNYMDVEYVFQDINDLPEGFTCPEGRTKPWGTGQAVLCAKSVVDTPYVIINADDYYGKEAFVKLHDFLVEHAKMGKEFDMGMAGFILKNTLSENGTVTTFLSNISDNPMKKEYLLPNIVAELLREDRINVKVLETHDKWFGVTYAEDKEYVQNAFKQLIEDGVYPEKLWK